MQAPEKEGAQQIQLTPLFHDLSCIITVSFNTGLLHQTWGTLLCSILHNIITCIKQNQTQRLSPNIYQTNQVAQCRRAHSFGVSTSDSSHLSASNVDAFSCSAISKELSTVRRLHVVTSSNPIKSKATCHKLASTKHHISKHLKSSYRRYWFISIKFRKNYLLQDHPTRAILPRNSQHPNLSLLISLHHSHQYHFEISA